MDTGRIMVEMRPRGVAHDACAADLQYGLDTMGLPECTTVLEASVLERGGQVLLPSPDCARFDRAHVLRVRRRDQGYEVTAVGDG